MNFFTDNFISWLCGEIFDSLSGAVKKQITAKRDKSNLEKELYEFIKVKQSEFYTVSLDSEYDFQGLSDYILNNMTKEFKTYLCGNIHQRESAKNTIIDKAIEYSSAISINAQEQVRNIVKQSLQIIFDFFANKIDLLTQINSNMIVDEIKNTTDNQSYETEKCINNNFAKFTDVNKYDEKVDIFTSIEKIKLPDYYVDIRPKKKDYKMIEISESRLADLFSKDILNYYKKLMQCISVMEYLISYLMTFYQLSCKPDSEGGFENKIWEKILEIENILSLPNCTEDKKKEFREFCNNNIIIEHISESSEDKEYNYFDIKQKMQNVRCLFDNTKKTLISQMKIYIY